MKTPALLSALLALAALVAADPVAPAPVPARPLRELPYTPGLDVTVMDRSADPCVDFYQYACGGWLKKNPIPGDESSWDVYRKTEQENTQFLWGLLEEAATATTRDASRQKIGDYFGSCMDEAAVESAGLKPIAATLADIDRLPSVAALPALLGRLHRAAAGRLLFGFGVEVDNRDATRYLAVADAGGLGLPDRDYYLRDDERFRTIRERYQAHVAHLLQLAGTPAAAAGESARAIVTFETALARASLTRTERRDPHRLDNPMAREAFSAVTPVFDWSAYWKALGAPAFATLNVREPAFYRELQAQLATLPLPVLKAYLRWHVVSEKAPYLSRAVAQADFDFYRRELRGVEEMSPRWKRCTEWVDRDLGEALGRVFVENVFPPEVKQSTVDMVRRVQEAMERRLDALPWMSPETKQQARAKLRGMRNKIGYPDAWRDYGALQIVRGDFAGNVERAVAFENQRQLRRVGQPVDRAEWSMTPPTVNAYYDAQKNDMNFPAGVLLPPLFDARIDVGPGYGNTGTTIGHELVHGFDDEGRQFDATGTLRDWWTPADAAEFSRRTQCVLDQYAQYTVVDDIKINSKLTLGEDVADLGGTVLAWLAWQDAVHGQKLEPREGLTPEQRFFVGFAQWACAEVRPETLRQNALTNPHSPQRFRVNGVVVNIPEFAAAFACKAGQPMVKPEDQVCRIW